MKSRILLTVSKNMKKRKISSYNSNLYEWLAFSRGLARVDIALKQRFFVSQKSL